MSSKFKDLMSQARNRETERDMDNEGQSAPASAAATAATTPPAPRKARTAKRPEPTTSAIHVLEPDRAVSLPSAQPVGKRRGRPRGKRSHPDFEQITAYISKQTYRNTKIALLQKGEGQQFSELVENLLGDWLKSR